MLSAVRYGTGFGGLHGRAADGGRCVLLVCQRVGCELDDVSW